jgi:hypothetical protein
MSQNFCHKGLVRISPQNTISAACALMQDNNLGCLIAENDGKLCSISLIETLPPRRDLAPCGE